MEKLSKIIIMVGEQSSMNQHIAVMEDMGSNVILINKLETASEKLKNKFDLIIINYSSELGKQFAEIHQELLNRSMCILLVADENEHHQANLVIRGAEVLVQPVSPAQLNQKAAQMICVPSRRHIKILVRMQLIDDPKSPFALGTMIDISENGMLLETEKQLLLDTHLKISFYLSETGGFVEIEGQVIRESRSSSPKIKCYGIRFIKVEKQFQEKINRFLLKLKSRKP